MTTLIIGGFAIGLLVYLYKSQDWTEADKIELTFKNDGYQGVEPLQPVLQCLSHKKGHQPHRTTSHLDHVETLHRESKIYG